VNTSRSFVTTKQFTEASAKWNSILSSGENICLVFPHLSDHKSRLYQWIQITESKKFFPIQIDAVEVNFDEKEVFEKYIINQLPESSQSKTLNDSLKKFNRQLVLVIIEGESLFADKNYKLLFFIQNLLVLNNNVLSLIAFEENVYQHASLMHTYDKLFQNILYYSLYEDSEMAIFVEHLCKSWSLKIPAKTKQQLITSSGGSFWLAIEACRDYRDTKTWNANTSGFRRRLEILAKSFSDKEAIILASLSRSKLHKNIDEYNYLKNTGFITKGDKLRIPFLDPFLRMQLQPMETLEIKKDQVFLRGTIVTHAFSPTEYSVLNLFISKPNNSISRDEIATAIWPNNTEEHYSTWAIDQAIKRLRDRLVSLGLAPTIISSVRGVGYEYRV
jgi:hypothetical protein